MRMASNEESATYLDFSGFEGLSDEYADFKESLDFSETSYSIDNYEENEVAEINDESSVHNLFDVFRSLSQTSLQIPQASSNDTSSPKLTPPELPSLNDLKEEFEYLWKTRVAIGQRYAYRTKANENHNSDDENDDDDSNDVEDLCVFERNEIKNPANGRNMKSSWRSGLFFREDNGYLQLLQKQQQEKKIQSEMSFPDRNETLTMRKKMFKKKKKRIIIKVNPTFISMLNVKLQEQAVSGKRKHFEFPALSSETKNRLKRFNSMPFYHSWNFIGYYWDEVLWRKKMRLLRSHKKKSLVQRKSDQVRDGRPHVRFPTVVLEKITDLEPDSELFQGIPFEEATQNEGLFFEESDVIGRKHIVAGTVENLVSRLADQYVPDAEYAKQFLFSFRNIIGPYKLFTMLLERYEFIPPILEQKESLEIYSKYSKAIQLRVINLMKKWLLFHFYDFSQDQRLIKKLAEFLEIVYRTFPKWAVQLQSIVQLKYPHLLYIATMDSSVELIEATIRREDSDFLFQMIFLKKEYYNMCFSAKDIIYWLQNKLSCTGARAVEICNCMLQRRIMFPLNPKLNNRKLDLTSNYRFSNKPVDPPPKSFIPSRSPSQFNPRFLDIHPTEIARQLTIISSKLYETINCKELSELVRSKCEIKGYKCPCIELLMKRFEIVSMWIPTEIVTSANLNLRIEVIKRSIDIANTCLKYKNFFDASAIVIGLQNEAIRRLQNTWKLLPRRAFKKFNYLVKTLMDSKTILETMQASRPPMIPALDIYLDELERRIVPLPDTLSCKDYSALINFKKLRIQSEIFEEIMKPNFGIKYGFLPIPQYCSYLEKELPILAAKDLILCSFDCEQKRHEVF